MKLINFIIKSMCGFSILISFASCDDFLDRDPSDRITEEEVFQKIQTAEEYLNNAYTFLPDFQTCTEDLGGRYKLEAVQMKSDINRLLALRKPPMILTMGTGMRLNFLCNVLGLIFMLVSDVLMFL